MRLQYLFQHIIRASKRVNATIYRVPKLPFFAQHETYLVEFGIQLTKRTMGVPILAVLAEVSPAIPNGVALLALWKLFSKADTKKDQPAGCRGLTGSVVQPLFDPIAELA